MGILDFLKPDVPDYTAAYAKIADEMAKSRKDIKSAVGTAEKIQEMNFQKNRQDLMPVFKITQNAMKELAAGSKSGRWNLGKLTLKNVESFEDYVSRTGENTEVRTAFDHVQKFKENVERTGRIDDPAYEFMQRQMERSVRRSQAATGNRLGGAGQKELSRYMADYANTKYGQAHQRSVNEGRLLEAGDTAAYNRVVGRHELERRNTMDANQISIDKFEANRQRIMNDLAIVRDQINLGGVRDMVNLRDQHSQNQQQTVLTGATALADLSIREAETRQQGLIAQQEAESASSRALLNTAGTIAGAAIGSMGGPAGAKAGAAAGNALTGGGGGTPVPASWRKLRAA